MFGIRSVSRRDPSCLVFVFYFLCFLCFFFGFWGLRTHGDREVYWVKVDDYADVINWYSRISHRCAMVDETDSLVDMVSPLAGFVGTRWMGLRGNRVGGGDLGLLVSFSKYLYTPTYSFIYVYISFEQTA